MVCEVKIIKDSIGHESPRLTTFQLRYWRAIHSEFMTHRMFSRNASSSRAIPVHKLIDSVAIDPAMPIFWGKNQPGMQAEVEMDEEEKQEAIAAWLRARDFAVSEANMLAALGVHKQLVNRIIEPWMHINVVMTSCEEGLMNFFGLRLDKRAMPEIRQLAEMMWVAYNQSEAVLLSDDEWHLPYVEDEDVDVAWKFTEGGEAKTDFLSCLIGMSIARCARVSYLVQDGKRSTVEEDHALVDRLLGSHPLHASPAEHQATPDQNEFQNNYLDWNKSHFHGNLPGWIQYRKILPNESIAPIPKEYAK
jgi:thymidylate synthase ThyX